MIIVSCERFGLMLSQTDNYKKQHMMNDSS